MLSKRHLYSIVLFAAAQYAAGQATSNCAGYISIGNPYPCCSDGNCTWWAWKEASDNWGVHLPGWGSAKTWVSDAREAGFIVNPIPAPSTIAVNLTAYDTTLGVDDGHAAWVLSLTGQQVLVSQMVCGSSAGMETKLYPISYFTQGGGGFIYPATHAPTPVVSHSTPLFITHSANSQSITINGTNLQSAKVVYTVSPSGALTILQGSAQLPVIASTYIDANLTLATPGRWEVVVIGSNGADSNTLYLNIE